MANAAVIKKLVVPYGIRKMLFMVPKGSYVVHVAADPIFPGNAAVWYHSPISDDALLDLSDEDEWSFAVFRTDDAFFRDAQYVGTAVVHDGAWHVLRVVNN